MFISLEQFYINSQSIEALGVYDGGANNYEVGIILNGTRYAIYTVLKNAPEELKEELRYNVKNIVKDIIQSCKQEVISVNIPRPDITKYQEQLKNTQEKAQLND
jgi:hypothetical protein